MPQEWGESDPCYIANSEVKSNNIKLSMSVPLKRASKQMINNPMNAGSEAAVIQHCRSQGGGRSLLQSRNVTCFFAQLLNLLLGEQFSCFKAEM